MFPMRRALIATLLVLAITAGAVPTAFESADLAQPQSDVHHDIIRNAMREVVSHRVKNDCNNKACDVPSDEEVDAIKVCIGRPTLLRMKRCMRQAAEGESGDDGGECIAPEQLERVWHCVERHALAGSDGLAPHHVDANMIPHRLYGKDRAEPLPLPSLSSSKLLLKDQGNTVEPNERLVKRKYGYGPNWLTAVGVRRAHPLP